MEGVFALSSMVVLRANCGSLGSAWDDTGEKCRPTKRSYGEAFLFARAFRLGRSGRGRSRAGSRRRAFELGLGIA
jgi:hypothetical protein